MTDQEGQTEQTQTNTQEQGTAETQSPASTSEREAPIEQVRQLKIRIESLEKELEQERDKATEYMNRALRAQADLSNMRKRLQNELSVAMREALKSIVYEQLGVLDSFDRAFTSLPKEFHHFTWVEGIGLIQSQLFNILYRVGITPIEVEKGKKYNPIEHEPVAYEETSDYPEDAVTAELQHGYKLQDQVLRPALVKIARAPQPVAASGTETENTETQG